MKLKKLILIIKNMSRRNIDSNRENKKFPSSNNSFKESVVVANKRNHIVIDGDLKKLYHKNDDKFQEIKSFKNSNSKFGKTCLKTAKNSEKFFSRNYKNDKEAIKLLKKKILELNGEINKLKSGPSVPNFYLLEKELTELRQ